MKKILLVLLIAVPVYLVMCKVREPEPEPEAIGELLYGEQLDRARGVQEQLQTDLEKRNAQMDQQMQQ